jgi:hypothetical protein
MPHQLQDTAFKGMGITATLRGKIDPDLTQRPAHQTQNPLDRQPDPHRLEADRHRSEPSQDHPFTPDFISTTFRAAQGEAILANVEMDGALVVTAADMLVAPDAKSMIE